MKRALIPTLLVICGAFASSAWRTLELPCEVSKLEIASAVLSPLLRCAANQLLIGELAPSELNGGGQAAVQPSGSRDAGSALLFGIFVNHAFDRFGSEVNSVGMSISSWLVRHRVWREFTTFRRNPQCSIEQKGERKMKFLSIYRTVERTAPPSKEEMEAMGKLIEEGMKAGWLVGTEGCLPTALGARVRHDNGNVTVTDGPFTESKEVVGGFAILRTNSKQEAIELCKLFLKTAGKFAAHGECELRQVYEAPEYASSSTSAAAV